MSLINIGKDRAIIKFNSDFYGDDSIIGGLTEFWPYFQNQFNFAVMIGQRPKYFTVTLKAQKGKKFERSKVFDFCNFVLQREIDRKIEDAQAR